MISDYCTDSIIISSYAADEFGSITYTDGDQIPSRVLFKNELMTGKNGQQIQSTCQVSFEKNYTIKLEDKIKIVKYKNVDYPYPDQMWIVKDIQRPGGFYDYYIKVML